jgi:hypothetical protein
VTANLCGCSRPVRSGYVICDTCRADLEKHLAETPWLNEQLDISLTRIKGVDYRSGGEPRGTETPLPWNDRASRARHELKNELVGWVRIVKMGSETWPRDDLVSIAAWLQSRLNTIAKRDDAWVICEEVGAAFISAEGVVFAKPRQRHFIGPCEGAILDDEIAEVECVGEIWLTEGANVAECDMCLRAYDPDAAIRARDNKLRMESFTASEIASIGHRGLGQPKKRIETLLNVWIKRKRITSHGHHVCGDRCVRKSALTGRACFMAGNPTFNYGDVMDMLRRVYERSA